MTNEGWLTEPLHDDALRRHLDGCRRRLADGELGATPLGKSLRLQYALRALERNGHGSLHSIDIDRRDFVPSGEAIGWVVPDRLRARWTLYLGDARDVLLPLLKDLGEIDVFIHDSLHTRAHMYFKYEAACPHLRPGGYLVSDDVLWNDAFSEFADVVEDSQHVVLRGVGFLRTPDVRQGQPRRNHGRV